MAKKGEFKLPKEYKAEYLKDLESQEFEPQKVPGVNEDFIKLDISTIS